ncbi:Oidioi.mRNA.OKI2018_I69.PAR.g9358.t1.cds [Oikopleura dioica]|uniref:Oidioi.mRNA.OKI2018_I69.PAR.g9358.t1.cds n=1 Tax=Oikopleura dioica TaxID=34765 RepID=A0ABN7RSR9_OIKDI|nr:Oidioi.mRNA.OKI2018_I69.PAR.g9358.t1.cds [Oikopleura dioica]
MGIVEQVAWCSKAEWLDVYSNLQRDRSAVLRRLQLWEQRIGADLPVAIVATIAALTGLEEIRNNRDNQGTMFCASGALVQAVGVITERYREANLPIHVLAAEIGIPDWVTNLRHQIAHGPCQSSIETLEDALEAVYEALTTDAKSYWVLQKEDYDKQKSEIKKRLSKDEEKALKFLARRIVEVDQEGLNSLFNEAAEIVAEEKYRQVLSEQLARRYSSLPRIVTPIWRSGFKRMKISNQLVLDLLRVLKLQDDCGRKPDKKLKEWIHALLGDCKDVDSNWMKTVLEIICESLDESSGGFIKALEKVVESSSRLEQREKTFFLKKLIEIKRVFNAMSSQQKISLFSKRRTVVSKEEIKEEDIWKTAEHLLPDTKERVYKQLCQ